MSEITKCSDRSIEIGPNFRAGPTGLEVFGDPAEASWRQAGERLQYMEGAVHWWVGDWLAYGERKWGRMVKAAQEIGFNLDTLKHDKWVASAIETCRRRHVLSWSHHMEVLAVPDLETQDHFLDLAESEALTRSQLRDEIRRYKRDESRKRMAAEGAGYDPSEAITLHHTDCMDLVSGLKDGSIDLLLTDPPYFVTANEWDTQWGSEDSYFEFMAQWLRALRPKMAEQFTAFVFCDADYAIRTHSVLHEAGWPILCQAIWDRQAIGKKRSGSKTFMSAYEPFWHCGTAPLNFPEQWGSERFDVQHFTLPQSSHKQDPAVHPTQKPLLLFRRLVELGSNPNGLVLDPFSGSGTTAVACQLEYRRCIAGDLSAEYIEIAKGRLAKIGGASES